LKILKESQTLLNIMENATFDFEKNSVEVITLDTLKGTRNETDYGYQPLNGIQHYDFIETILSKINQNGLDSKIEKIYAGRGGSRTVPGVSFVGDVNNEGSKRVLKNYILRRVIGKILISNLATEEYMGAVAFSYHQLGLEVAIGANITICSNMSIYGKQFFFSTYGDDKLPNLNRLYEVLDDYLAKYEETMAMQKKFIDGLKSIALPREHVAELIGDLTFLRIAHDNNEMKDQPKYPLNQSQIGSLAEKYLVEEYKKKSPQPIQLYDLYNYATNMYKPGETDFPNVLVCNSRLGQYLIDKFNLNYLDYGF